MRITTLIIATLLYLHGFAQTTVTLKPAASQGKDVVLPWHSPNDNHATNTSLHVTAWTYSGNPTLTRILLDFDLSAIPAGSVVHSATLNLYFNPTSGFNSGLQEGANEGALYRVIESWDEATVTWNNKPDFTTSGSISYPATVNYDDDLTLNVTQMVQLFVDSPAISHGFMLKLDDEQSYRARLFASSDHTNSALHPELVIQYTPTGIEEHAVLAANTSVYPVPASNALHITTTHIEGNEIKYRIVDALGATVAENTTTEQAFSIDINALASGNYLLHIQSGTANTVKRFVKE